MMPDPDMDQKVEQLKAELREQEAAQEREQVEAIRALYPRAAYALAPHHYILDGDEVRCVDLAEWAMWFEYHANDRMIARTVVQEGIDVSTVFLRLDHRFGGGGPPILFETMVFGGLLDQEMERYVTIAEARAGHRAMVERVKRAEAGESL